MTVRIVPVLCLLAFTLACESSSMPFAAPTPKPAPPPTPAANTVSIVAGSATKTTTAYSPNPVTLAAGGTVTWVNNDTTTHTSTADGGAWASGSIAPGGQFSRTFGTAGTFTYHCSIHPNMIGTVQVQ